MDKDFMIGNQALKLWYRQPASCWSEALPLGNGRIGAMIYGNPCTEIIDLSEITCFSGEEGHTHVSGNPSVHFYKAREALLNNDYGLANDLLKRFVGKRTNYGTNLPLGRIRLNIGHDFKDISDYQRSLCLNSAVSSVSYRKGNSFYSYTAFVSNPHQVMVIKLESDSGNLDLTVSIDGGDNPFTAGTDENMDLVLSGYAYEEKHSDGKTGVGFFSRLRAVPTGGTMESSGTDIIINNAEQVILYLAVETLFNQEDAFEKCRNRIDDALRYPYEKLLKEHIADFRSLFDRVELYLGETKNIPADILLDKVRNGYYSPYLTALMFQYGRYLLISSSRSNSPLPAHLQGVWNDSVACRIGWTCDMHLDINTQMNYWPCEVTNLAECHVPLFRWIEEKLVPSGRETAKLFYGLNGWVAELVSNAWGFTDPYWHVNLSPCPTGGAWIATHMWEHYLFNRSYEFLKNHAYPVIREAVLFFIDYIFTDPASGFLTSGPSISPENHFCVDGKPYSASLGPFYEIAVIRELFDIFLEASEILKVSDELCLRVKNAINALPPFQVGKNGELKEWSHDFEEKDPQHRHTSHLLALYPFSLIDVEKTPELAEAARVTIKRRMNPPENWEDTGWARCMLMLYSARLKDAEWAFEHIQTLQMKLTNNNLMVKHPPTRGAPSFADVYELDGNTGFTACVAEMLIQSHRSETELLPALPKAWKSGRVKGLCARGGFVVDLEWKENILTHVRIHAKVSSVCRLRYGKLGTCFNAEAGKTYEFDGNFSPLTLPRRI